MRRVPTSDTETRHKKEGPYSAHAYPVRISTYVWAKSMYTSGGAGNGGHNLVLVFILVFAALVLSFAHAALPCRMLAWDAITCVGIGVACAI